MSVILPDATWTYRDDLRTIGSAPASLGTPDNPIGEIYATEAVVNTVITGTVNGAVYPPAFSGTLVDDTTFVEHSTEPTARIGFDAAGAPSTDGVIRMAQATDMRTWTFPDHGADSEVLLTDGAQQITGTKTVLDSEFTVTDASDTFAVGFSVTGGPGVNAVLTSAGQTGFETMMMPAASTTMMTTNGTQTISGDLKLFTPGTFRVVDSVDNTVSLSIATTGGIGTTATVSVGANANRAYIWPDVGGATATTALSGVNKTFTGPKLLHQTSFVHQIATPTIRNQFNILGSAGVTTTLEFTSPVTTTYVVPTTGAATTIICGAPAQTISGVKTFSAGAQAPIVSEVTLDAGVSLNEVVVRQNAYTARTGSTIGGGAGTWMIPRAKGTAGVQMRPPDGTVFGGNARGQFAVDLQVTRAAADQVASGNYACLLGGQNNRASAYAGTCFVGNSNVVHNAAPLNMYSVIAGGQSNTVTSARSTIYASDNCTCGGPDSAIVGSFLSTIATGVWGAIVGGNTCTIEATAMPLVLSTGSAIVASSLSTMRGATSAIVGGSNHYMDAGTYSIIFGGTNHEFALGGEYEDCAIVGGFGHTFTGAAGVTTNCAIVGGRVSTIANGATDSAIVGGEDHAIGSGTANGCVLGGQHHVLGGAALNENNVLMGGDTNQILGASRGCGIYGGHDHTITGAQYSFIFGGNNCTISNDNCCIFASIGSICEGFQNTIIGGQNNHIQTNDSVIIGSGGTISGGDGTILIAGSRIFMLYDVGATWLQGFPTANDADGIIPQGGLYHVNGVVHVQAIGGF